MIEFNVNDKVQVKVTERGQKILAERYKGHDAIRPKPDADGWTTYQLWCLMADFGEHLFNGCNPPFETRIRILENQCP